MGDRRWTKPITSAREIELLVAGRVPPQDLDAEAACISAAMLSREALGKLRDVLPPEACYAEANRWIVEAMFDLDARGEAVDIVTVANELRAREKLGRVGGSAYLGRLVDASPAVGNVLEHARLVVAHYKTRLALTAFWTLLAEGYEAPRQVTPWLEGAAARITAIGEIGGHRSGATLAQALSEAHVKLMADQRGEGRLTGLPTGFYDLDRQTGGIELSDVLLVCGIEGRGKSALAHSMAMHIASTPDLRDVGGVDTRIPRGVVIFSADNMSRSLVAHRMACARGRVNGTRFRTGDATPEDWKRLTDASVELEALPILIEDETLLTPLRMRMKLRQAKRDLERQFGAELVAVVLDYVQLMRLDRDDAGMSTEQKLNEVGKQLMRMAKDFRVAMLVLSQINADGTTMHARSLQQDAQCKIVVDWKKRKPKVLVPGIDPDKNGADATIDVQKWRNGATGKVHTNFYPAYTLFTDEVL